MDTKSFQINLEAAPELTTKTILGEWKPLVKVGNFGSHPVFGEINFTPEKLDKFYDNFKLNAIGRDLSFNYNHNGKSQAALWVKDMRKITSPEGVTIGLEYLPEYTPSGYKAIVEDKDFKYASLEYKDNFKEFGPTIFNAACTNDPFLTGEGLTLLGNNLENNKAKDGEKIMEETKKLEAEMKEKDEAIKKLEAENERIKLEREAEIKKLEAEVRKSRVSEYRRKWMSERVPGGLIEIAEAELMKDSNSTICLDNNTGFSILNYTETLFSKLPDFARVNLEQSATSKKEEKPEKIKTDEEESETILLEAVKKINN